MKTITLKLAATAIVPAALLALTGCKSPANPLATQSIPALAGGTPVVETFDQKGEVASLTANQRTLAIRSKDGATVACKAGPEVANLDQIKVGDKVKARITDAVALFPAKNGPPPSAGAGVTIAGPPDVVLQTTDTSAKVTKVDRSYRLMTVEYANGSTKEFKVPLPDTLIGVQKGDTVVVRATEPLALCLKQK